MIIMPRFFVDQQPQDGVLTLTGENAHHAGRVLRLRVGEGVTLCDGAGMDFDCTVEAVEKEAVTCRVVSCHAADTEPKQSITLFMALPKGDKMEFIVQKAVELGVSRIVPYLSKNCVSRPDNQFRRRSKRKLRPQSILLLKDKLNLNHVMRSRTGLWPGRLFKLKLLQYGHRNDLNIWKLWDAASMQVARTTVQRIYEIARKKIADSCH